MEDNTNTVFCLFVFSRCMHVKKRVLLEYDLFSLVIYTVCAFPFYIQWILLLLFFTEYSVHFFIYFFLFFFCMVANAMHFCDFRFSKN